MSAKIYSATGSTLILDRKLGEGGEGTVYVAPGDEKTVVKIYNRPISPIQASKLRAMAAIRNPTLQSIAAWPLDVVFDAHRGVVGYTMPRLNEQRPIHDLFGNKYRQRHFPNANWAFLVHAARNLSSAFKVLHESNIVVGDVNPNNIVAYQNAIVQLIDCDSFQFSYNGTVYRCDVGMGEYQPKELQNIDLSVAPRTREQDLFGLAVVIFQLCFVGKHPFEGVRIGSGSATSATREENIAQGRFFYDDIAKRAGLTPPPASITLGAVTPLVASLFERAFRGNPETRPRAAEWSSALEAMEREVVVCSANPAHRYFKGTACPWCAIETSSQIVYFLSPVLTTKTGELDESIWKTFSNDHVNEIWRAIVGLGQPGPAYTPTVPSQVVAATPLPKDLTAHAWRFAVIMFAVICAAGAFEYVSQSPTSLGILIAVCLAWFPLRPKATDEIAKREASLQAALSAFDAAEAEWRRVATAADVTKLRASLERVKIDLLEQPAKYDAEYRALEREQEQLQRRVFLDGHLIKDYKIKGIGSKRVATLASFNVESAWDVYYPRIISIPGFGPSTAEALMTWRRRIEAQFRFDPRKGIDPKILRELKTKHISRRANGRDQLMRGRKELENISQQLRTAAPVARSNASACRDALEKARADMKKLPPVFFQK